MVLYEKRRHRVSIMMLSTATFFCLVLLPFAKAHPTVAGSCDAPHSGFHGPPQKRNGGFKLSVIRTDEKNFLLRLGSSNDRQTFRGFQIICEACQFLNLPKEDAQFNTRYCTHPGRVCHTNNNDKKRVEIEMQWPEDNERPLDAQLYVVKTQEEWYGPMRFLLHSNGTSKKNDRTSQASTEKDFSFMAQLEDYFTLHWTVFEGHSSSQSSGSLDLLCVVETPGWASLAFASKNGQMHPADAVLGWIEENGTASIESYRIVRDSVDVTDVNSTLFHIHSIERRDRWLWMRFTKALNGGMVSVDLKAETFINYATGTENRLIQHNQRGSIVLNFTSGQIRHVSSRKFYEAHGCLMIVAWVALVPFSIVVARSKWSPSVMGLYGWLDVHRGLHFFSAISIFIALMIALLTFQPIHSSTGRIHRVLGILVCIIFFCQLGMGIFRPGLGNPIRAIFNAAHIWSGRSLMLFGWMTVFVGVSAFHYTSNAAVTSWIVSILVLLALQIVLALYFESFVKRPQRNNIEEVDLVTFPYQRPQDDESDEHYNLN